MSLYLYNYTNDWAIVGADTRKCISLDGKQHYRLNDTCQKIFEIDDMVITIGGKAPLAEYIINTYKQVPNKTIEILREIIILSCNNSELSFNKNDKSYCDEKLKIEVTVLKYESGRHIVYNIASYNDFKIIKQESEDNILSKFIGGFFTDETEKVYYDYLALNYFDLSKIDFIELYRKVYEVTASEKVGGTLVIYFIQHGNVVKTQTVPINDSRKILDVPPEISSNYGMFIVGRSSKFNGMQIYDANNDDLICEVGNYKSGIDGSAKRGIKVQGGSLEVLGNAPTLTFGNNVVIDSSSGINAIRSDNKIKTSVNATEGFKISAGTGNGTFPNSIVSIDTTGKAIFNGEIIAKDFKDSNGNSLFSLDKTKIKGSVIEADSLYVNSANITGTIIADELRGNVAKLAEEVTIGNASQMPSGYRTINFYNGSGNRAGISLDNQGNLIQNSTFGFNIISNAEFSVDAPSGINIEGYNSNNYISGANNYFTGKVVTDDLQVYGDVGFYGTNPIAKQSATRLASTATLSSVINTVNGIMGKLENLGLLTVNG